MKDLLLFRLLTGGSRTALPRQQTLRALIDWSYDLLDERERALFRRLSVFAGGWTLEACEAVCAIGDVDEWEIVDLLSHLVDKSLVVFDDQGYAETAAGTTAAAAEPRYRLSETIRQYGRDRLLESGEGTPLRDRHRDFFCAWPRKRTPICAVRKAPAGSTVSNENTTICAPRWSGAAARPTATA